MPVQLCGVETFGFPHDQHQTFGTDANKVPNMMGD